MTAPRGPAQLWHSVRNLQNRGRNEGSLMIVSIRMLRPRRPAVAARVVSVCAPRAAVARDARSLAHPALRSNAAADARGLSSPSDEALHRTLIRALALARRLKRNISPVERVGLLRRARTCGGRPRHRVSRPLPQTFGGIRLLPGAAITRRGRSPASLRLAHAVLDGQCRARSSAG